MVGLESSMEMAESATKVKTPKVNNAEKERQRAFLAQLRSRKPEKTKVAGKKAKAASRAKNKKKMKKAAKGETYYCGVCGCEVVCTTESDSPIVCCEEVMYVI